MTTLRAAVLIAAAVLAAPVGHASARAQEVARHAVVGRVVEAETGQAVTGALVTLLPAEGAPEGARQAAGDAAAATDGPGVATGLTGPDGGFRLRAPRPGSYRLRAEAIGYAGARSEGFTVAAGGSTGHELALTPRPLALGELKVSGGGGACATPREQGAALQAVWEEARKALHAVSWTQRASRLVYDVETYRRELSPVSLETRSRDADTVFSAPAGRPFATLPPEELERNGYIQQGPMGSGPYTYYAPDAEVVLSDAFLQSHCFRLETGGPGGWVGLGFRPPRGRRESDIAGVLWVDRETAELRLLEFRYTRLPFDIPGSGLGGRIAFRRVATGEWIIAEWWIRAPQLTRRTRRLAAIEERGARVLQVRTADGGTVFVGGRPDGR